MRPLEYSPGKLTRSDIPFLIVLFSLGLFLFLFYVWAMPLIDPDEPRYASTARDMVLNGNWIVPYFNGAPRINKPPLFYWTVAVSYKIFGINELSARLPSALAATGMIIITYVWGKRLGGQRNGFWAGVILMSSPLFFFISRFCITDMLLAFFVCASLYLFFIEYTETRKSNPRRLLLYFLLSMAFLVKGPIGIVLFTLITICFLLWIRDANYIKRLWYLPGFLLFLGIICAWGIPFWLSLGTEKIISLFSQETSGRFVSGYAHPEPFYYYLPVFMMGFFPWSLLVFITFISLYKERKILSAEEKKPLYFFCSWLIVTLVFFSLSRSKLMTYILPLAPSVALLTIPALQWEMNGRMVKVLKWVLWVTLGLSTAIPILLITTIPKWAPVKYGVPTYHIAIPISIFLLGTLIALFIFIKERRFSQVQKVFCFTNYLFLVITLIYLATYVGTVRSTKDIIRKSSFDNKEEYLLLSYARTVPSLVFYSGKQVIDLSDTLHFEEYLSYEKGPAYIVMALKDYQKKSDWIKKKRFHVVSQNKAHILLQHE